MKAPWVILVSVVLNMVGYFVYILNKIWKMRDKTHIEQVEIWAEYVRENPDKWKSKVKLFLDSQLIMARRFYSKLAKTKECRKKIKLLKGIKK